VKISNIDRFQLIKISTRNYFTGSKNVW